MIYWTLLLILTLPVLMALFRLAFANLDSVVEAIVYFFTPGGVAAAAGDSGEAFWAKIKVVAVIVAWGIVVLGLHHTLGSFLNGVLF